MEDTLTILVPVYNEEDNIVRLEIELLEFLKQSIVDAKVLFINDCSTDTSQELIESICQKHTAFNYILFSENKGLSAALKAGFDNVNSSLVGYIDADLQTSPKDFNLLLEHVKNHELVTGIRVNRKDGIIKRWSSKIANRIRRLFTNDGMLDTGCPLKIIKTSYAKNIPMFKGLHRFLPALILLQNGTIKQVPVNHFPRTAGYSKFGLRQRLVSPLIDCFAYLWMKRRAIHYTIEKKNF
ncbi:glycosyltransferase [uncultured Psychroserpens sp.]|uniref:glycosyltransferase n=1 Tax=uncultured Psychroserpens sp. TaxID=255436 RepID=UPI00262158B0|nr:glycosyltransferase [uncultured Psychroserpens sp.]